MELFDLMSLKSQHFEFYSSASYQNLYGVGYHRLTTI